MNISFAKKESGILLAPEGKIDTITSPDFKDALLEALQEGDTVVDMAGITFISSVGLRVVLVAQKQANKDKRKLTFININDGVMDVFKMTGFINMVKIE